MAVDADYLYWTSSVDDRIEDVKVIVRANLDGIRQQNIVSGDASPVGLALTAPVNWTDELSGTVNVVNRDGSNPRVLIPGQASPYGIAILPPTP